jgi:hypothetical protein
LALLKTGLIDKTYSNETRSRIVLGDEVKTVKKLKGVEAGITLTHYLKNPLSKELPGLMLEPLNSSSLHVFAQPKSMNGFHLNNPHSLYFTIFLLRFALGVFQWYERK